MKIAVSSWALHRTLGVSYPDSPATGPKAAEVHAKSQLPLSDLPAELRAHGFDTVELCHFHVPSIESARLKELRSAFEAADVEIQSLLIDDGDLSDAECGSRDAGWITKWIDAAAILGASRTRVIAGKSPFERTAFERSLRHVSDLADCASNQGVRLTIENWFPLLASPASVLEFLDRTEGRVGLCADFGNWEAPRKYADLGKILPRAETCHAKCDFLDPDTIDQDDYGKCLDSAREAGFQGPYVLVNGGPSDEWRALDLTRQAILASA
jgi:sugar phosphate isomerase/epimerase